MTDPPKGWYLEYINKKLNMQLLYSLGVSFLDIYPREMKTCVHKQNLYPEVFSSFIHHSHELQATQMSFNKQTVKQAGARACYGTPVRGEEEGTTDTHDSPEAPPEDFGEGEQPSPPSYELCDITYMTKFETSSGAKEGPGLRVWVMKSGRG